MTPLILHTDRPRRSASDSVVVLLCFLTITFDGYDLVVYGTTVPSILRYEAWDISPGPAGSAPSEV